MGLDMFLFKTRINKEDEVECNIYDTEESENIEEVGYWRKANHIHKWFVDNVQNGIDECEEYVVSKEKLEQLLNVCETIDNMNHEFEDMEIEVGANYSDGVRTPIMDTIKIIKDASVIDKLLPTKGGFFFGSTDYDEHYLKDVKDTINILKDVLNNTDFDEEVISYHSSW